MASRVTMEAQITQVLAHFESHKSAPAASSCTTLAINDTSWSVSPATKPTPEDTTKDSRTAENTTPLGVTWKHSWRLIWIHLKWLAKVVIVSKGSMSIRYIWKYSIGTNIYQNRVLEPSRRTDWVNINAQMHTNAQALPWKCTEINMLCYSATVLSVLLRLTSKITSVTKGFTASSTIFLAIIDSWKPTLDALKLNLLFVRKLRPTTSYKYKSFCMEVTKVWKKTFWRRSDIWK